MGKPRDIDRRQQLQHIKVESCQLQQLCSALPPPPPLQPRPNLELAKAAGATTMLYDNKLYEDEKMEEEEPIDYSMKRHLANPPRTPSPVSVSASLASSSSSPVSASVPSVGDDVLHRLRHTVLQRHPRADTGSACFESQQLQQAVLANKQRQHLSQQLPKQGPLTEASATTFDSNTDSRAVYAAECIKSRLEGCGKRVHLFLGILLHFGMPPGRNGEQLFDRVIAFSDEHKNLSSDPTPYFIVLDSKLLALIWCKFKGNSSSEYSTLTRAIRSTRQKYRGIFEAVENPGKKLYKFGPVALEQFRNLFPGSYAGTAG